MILTFDANTGRLIQVLYDKDVFPAQSLSGTAAFTDFPIDEVAPDNKSLCFDLSHKIGRVDASGNPKYYMVNNAGTWELHQTDGWVEKVEMRAFNV